jgi:hypothetical protein
LLHLWLTDLIWAQVLVPTLFREAPTGNPNAAGLRYLGP